MDEHVRERWKTTPWLPDNVRRKRSSSTADDEDGDAAAMEEAVLQMRLRHEHIVRIVDVFHEPGVRGCFVEELMRGGTVHEWRCEGALKEKDACAIFSRRGR